MPRHGITLTELAERIDARLEGDGGAIVSRVATLEHAGPDAVAFLSQPRYRPLLARTQAGAVILTAADAPGTSRPRLVHPNPYAAYARAASVLHTEAPAAPGVDPSARVAPDAVVDATASVGPFAVIESQAFVGPRAVIGSHVHVGADATIAEDVRLHPHVTVYPRSIVGARTVVHAGAVLGADGFGMAEENGRWLRIPQIGRVVVGADCEIGANTTIDRGAIDDTVIEDDVKLDNQIQIGHNCRIGAHTAIAGCVGIAGSAVIGRNVRIGGAAMIAGHLTIPDDTVIAGATTVISSIRAAGAYNGSFPLMTQHQWRHAAVEVRRLRDLAARVAALERALHAREDDDEGDET